MTTTIERPRDVAPVRSSRWAWVAIALFPVGFFLSLVVEYLIAEKVFGISLFPPPDVWPMGKWLLVEVPSFLVGLAAPVIGLALGVRAARSGNRRGTVAATVAAAIALALIGFFLASAVSTEFGQLTAQ